MNNDQLINQTSGNVEWYTPWGIIQCARMLMGNIDLDPFSCKKANDRPEGSVAAMYFSSGGLEKQWAGNIWMNHPFGEAEEPCKNPCKKKICIERGHHISRRTPGNSDYINKLIHEYTRPQSTVISACCITYASTSEKWFAPLMRYPQFFFTGRTSYLDSTTMQPVKGVPKGSVITWFPPRNMLYQTAVHVLSHSFTFSGKFEGKAK